MSISVRRTARKLGVLAAGAALCIGMVGVPSAWADEDAPITLSPAGGWVQWGEEMVISGTDCPGQASVMWSNTEEEWKEGMGAGDGVSVDANGNWSYMLAGKDEDGNFFSITRDDGQAVIVASCWIGDQFSDDATLVYTSGVIHLAVTAVSVPSGSTGEDIPAHAEGFLAGETVIFTLSDADGANPVEIGRGDADENGIVETTINVPITLAIGTYLFTARGSESDRTFIYSEYTISEDIKTSEEPNDDTSTSDKLVETGGTVVPSALPLIGCALVLMGAILAIGRRAYQR